MFASGSGRRLLKACARAPWWTGATVANAEAARTAGMSCSRRCRRRNALSLQLPDGLRVPDPASRYQPQDVHGPSEVIDPSAYEWTDRDWRGRPWDEAVLYELHIGAFTPEGTFRAAIEKSRSSRRARRDRDRDHAGRGFPGRAQLGLRRRVALRARR